MFPTSPSPWQKTQPKRTTIPRKYDGMHFFTTGGMHPKTTNNKYLPTYRRHTCAHACSAQGHHLSTHGSKKGLRPTAPGWGAGGGGGLQSSSLGKHLSGASTEYSRGCTKCGQCKAIGGAVKLTGKRKKGGFFHRGTSTNTTAAHSASRSISDRCSLILGKIHQSTSVNDAKAYRENVMSRQGSTSPGPPGQTQGRIHQSSRASREARALVSETGGLAG